MANVTVKVNSSGDANDPGVAPLEQIQWVLDTGVAGPFSLNPPRNIFENNDSPKCCNLSTGVPSPIYKVKAGASVGKHYYTIYAGTCKKKGVKPRTGTQKITVTTGAVQTAGQT